MDIQIDFLFKAGAGYDDLVALIQSNGCDLRDARKTGRASAGLPGMARELVLVKGAPCCENCCFVVQTQHFHRKGRP